MCTRPTGKRNEDQTTLQAIDGPESLSFLLASFFYEHYVSAKQFLLASGTINWYCAYWRSLFFTFTFDTKLTLDDILGQEMFEHMLRCISICTYD